MLTRDYIVFAVLVVLVSFFLNLLVIGIFKHKSRNERTLKNINMQIKKTSENPLLDTLYATLLKGREHELLHRNMTGE